MAVRVSPTEKTPSHHLSLSDGTHTLGLILANGKGERDPRGIKQNGYPRSVTRISQNVAGYSDFELPYSPQVQQDWSGGRGLEDFDRDTTRFFDSYRADTTRGDIVCGPKETLTDGEGNMGAQATAAATLNLVTSTEGVIVSSFIAQIDNIETLEVLACKQTAGITTGYVVVYNDSAGTPGTIISSETLAFSANPEKVLPYAPEIFSFSTRFDSCPLTIGAQYWVGFYSPDLCLIGIHDAPVGTDILMKSTASGWVNWMPACELYFKATPKRNQKTLLFEYRSALFAVVNGASPRLYMNGYRGMAADNSARMKQVVTAAARDDLTGAVIKIVSGVGAQEDEPYRHITGYTATPSKAFIVDRPWILPQDTTTEWVIQGLNNWTAISGHGLTKQVTDVLVVDNVVYFAQGDATNIRRGQLKADSTWDTWADDGTNKATFLALIPDSEGKKKVWLVKAQTSSVSCADAKAWGTNLAPMATWLTCGSTDSKITGLDAYSSDGGLIPYILKEDGFGSIGGTTKDKVGVYAEHPLSAQIKKVRSEKNGRAHMRYDLFLKFSLLDGLESHFDQRLDDVGPNRDEGLPSGRRGPIVYLAPYAGRFYAAVDAGPDGYSSILCCTQDNCWHEIYRAGLGLRLQGLAVQVIAGGDVDRLWVVEEGKIYWLPITIDPRKQADYTYFSGAQVTTASIFCGFKDVVKYFDSLTIFAENLAAGHQYVGAAYQTDNEVGTNTWHPLFTNFDTSPAQTLKLSASNNVAGKRIRLRLTLVTDDPTKSPRVKALRLDSVIRLKPKKMWTVTYLVKDNLTDLSGMPVAPITPGLPLPEDTQNWLDAFADSDTTACPVTLRHLRTMFDNKTVFVEPNSISPLTQVTTPNGETVQIGSFNLLEA
jgi:hypothetical protein